MKLLKIGSSPMCDLVLNSEFVSSHHADITVLDNGDIILEDKNSTNGTFVGNKQIKPNQETPIRRGDYVRFGDTDLVWAKVPHPENTSKYKAIVNIGSNFRNDIVVSSETVSRYHATLKIAKDGKAYIIDNGSKNGTQVNGVKIHGLTRLKKGDNVVCGNEDITESLAQYMPAGFPKWAWYCSGIVAVAAVIVCLFLFPSDPGQKGKIVKPEQVKPTVVYVRATFHYNLILEDNPFSNETKFKELFSFRSKDIDYQATAFFIDKKGHLATNRHVAVPWMEEYRGEGTTEMLREQYQEWLLGELKVPSWQFIYDEGKLIAINELKRTELGNALIAECGNFDELQAKINTIEKSKIIITGEITDLTVGYPGKNYTHYDEFQRCHVVCESGDPNIDLAILRLNDKQTPKDIIEGKTDKDLPIVVLSPSDVVTTQLVPMEEQFSYIGYPNGLMWALDDNIHSLEPSVGGTLCSKEPSRYTFEFRSDAKGGSSGSPIFNGKGQLVGVLSSGIEGETVTYAVHARYLKKMYDEEINYLNSDK